MTTATNPNSSYARRCSLVAVNHTEIQMLSGGCIRNTGRLLAEPQIESFINYSSWLLGAGTRDNE